MKGRAPRPYHILGVVEGLLVGPVHGELGDVHLVAGGKYTGDLHRGPVQGVNVAGHRHVHAVTSWQSARRQKGAHGPCDVTAANQSIRPPIEEHDKYL